MGSASDDVFSLPDVAFRPVSPRLVPMRRTAYVLLIVPVTVGLALLLGLTVAGWLALLVVGLAVVALGWGWVALGRTARSWAYAERADDLLIVHGVLIRRLVVVPYGRMQLVDVHVGPLDRAFGLARVQLHTAAATTDAHIPGLEPAEATVLRERLAALGEARSAGL
ncbi:MAG TPA: PH domain-containing protein [Actinomycetes bacterium]|nr:PH domain-containing protein [Actinomycetes bacterium]